MPAEAAVSVTVKSKRGDLHTLRGDSAISFATNAVELLGNEAGAAFVESVKDTFRSVASIAYPDSPLPTTLPTYTNDPRTVPEPDEAQAVANVVQAFPGTTTVGTPLQQPQPHMGTMTTTAAPSAAPDEPQPGELREVNGEWKKWIPAGVSKTGKPYKAFWGKP